MMRKYLYLSTIVIFVGSWLYLISACKKTSQSPTTVIPNYGSWSFEGNTYNVKTGAFVTVELRDSSISNGGASFVITFPDAPGAPLAGVYRV